MVHLSPSLSLSLWCLSGDWIYYYHALSSHLGDCLIMAVPNLYWIYLYACTQGKWNQLFITDCPWVSGINVMMIHVHQHSVIIFIMHNYTHTLTHTPAGSIKGSAPSVQSHSVSLARNNHTVITTLSLHDVFRSPFNNVEVLAVAQPCCDPVCCHQYFLLFNLIICVHCAYI